MDRDSTAENSGRKKALTLYNYLKELGNLRSSKVVDIAKHQTPSPYLFYLDELPSYQDFVEINWKDVTDKLEDDGAVDSPKDYVIKVQKPAFQRCPAPPDEIKPWLADGWDNRKTKAVRIFPGRITRFGSSDEFLPVDSTLPDPVPDNVELFQKDPIRQTIFESWHAKRDLWYEEQRQIENAQNLFIKLCTMREDLNRESETYEIMLGTGFLVLRQNPEINHPILLQKANIRFDAGDNVIFIEDADDDPELYTSLVQGIEGLTLSHLQDFENRIINECLHPLDRSNAPSLLKELAHSLTPRSEYSDQPSKAFSDPSVELRIYNRPVMFMRKMLDGTAKAVERVIEDISSGAVIPNHLLQIVQGGTIPAIDYEPESIEQRLAEVGGESKEVLLAKQANKEQLEIARRIEDYDAVLVQGPPGTGKTHTIANLTGHFLAQGKSILITSQTPKALSVLKDKLPGNLQDLCVSILDGTNADMEKSIDGITEHMASNTSSQMATKAQGLEAERNSIINKLADVRKKLFEALNKEYESITICGNSISPAEAARFVADNEEELRDIIPDELEETSFPLSNDELKELYRSNADLGLEEETELGKGLPSKDEIADPSSFEESCTREKAAEEAARELIARNDWNTATAGSTLFITTENGTLHLDLDNAADLSDFASLHVEQKHQDQWFATIAATGKRGGALCDRWETLFEQIEIAVNANEAALKTSFGYNIEYNRELDFDTLEKWIDTAEQLLAKYGNLEPHPKGLFARLRKTQEIDPSTVRANGYQISNREALNAARIKIQADKELSQCEQLWNQQAAPCGLPNFSDLDHTEPQKAAQRWVPVIKTALQWYTVEFKELLLALEQHIDNASLLFREDPLQSDREAVERALEFSNTFLPNLLELISYKHNAFLAQRELSELAAKLEKGSRRGSVIRQELVSAIRERNFPLYKNSYIKLTEITEKEKLFQRRKDLLARISKVAPIWAHNLEHRVTPHDSDVPPSNIMRAWRWRQYEGVLKEIASTPINKLQNEAAALARHYRKTTANLAEARAWEHLLRRTERDISLKQSLLGWRDTMKRIGKGTGKRAPLLRKEARRLMTSCQKAVPAWVMPMKKALSTLDPRTNKFDVIIIDEASQSDITSLAITYLAKKLIVVGDDKQVSPLAVGVDSTAEDQLADMYLRDKIPNAHLYGSKLSLYDIALQTYQPLMLKEHFRCVPDIIGYSNMLSYDYRIKPLRDASSSNLLPAIVPYRVKDAHRDPNKKMNREEAEEIIRLISACASEPEYEGKTFGVISMLGNDQVKLLQQLAIEKLDPQLREDRKILIGDAANFQGDERDVIFLSMVDSPKTQGSPLSMTGFGADDRTKKRYNVAVSRAKDQLWVVYSMDPNSELKPGDIRKGLIDYARCPSAFQKRADAIQADADSPFEAEVGQALVARGYKIKQQWEVGAYRIDMVVYDDNGKAAIECDGERWHSGEDAICADMERQAILERLGWRFIRIRGSEYYRNKDAAIERVIKELGNLGINSIETAPDPKAAEDINESDLLRRVKVRAEKLREKHADTNSSIRQQEAIEAALSSEPFKVGPNRGDSLATCGLSAHSHIENPAVSLQERADAILKEIDERPGRRSGSERTTGEQASQQPEKTAVSDSGPRMMHLVPSSVEKLEYTRANVPHLILESSSYTDARYIKTIAEHMAQFIDVEAPIEKQRLFNDTRESLGIKRSGAYIQQHNQMILDTRVPHKETTWNGREYIWKNDQEPDVYHWYRPNTQQFARGAYEIPYEELRSAVLAAMRREDSLTREELIKESARKFGYQRIKGRLTETFNKALDQMLKEGTLSENENGYIRCHRSQHGYL